MSELSDSHNNVPMKGNWYGKPSQNISNSAWCSILEPELKSQVPDKTFHFHLDLLWILRSCYIYTYIHTYMFIVVHYICIEYSIHNIPDPIFINELPGGKGLRGWLLHSMSKARESLRQKAGSGVPGRSSKPTKSRPLLSPMHQR